MANLSNINNKFLFTDGDFLKIGNLAPINNISSTESGISVTNSNVASITLDNTAASGKRYVMYSSGNGSLVFWDGDAASARLQIDSSGMATFAGRVNAGESFGALKDGADTVANGPFFRLTNAATTRQYLFQLDASNNIDYWYYNGSTWTQTISLLTNGGATFTGNVGIETTTPLAKLQVGAEQNSNATGISLAAGASVGNLIARTTTHHNWLPYTDGSNYYSADNHIIRNASHSTEWMRVNSSGNVGIGTTSPDFALDIEAVSSGVQLQIGRTVTNAGSTWMGSDSNGFHLGVGAYGAGNSVSDPNGFTVDTSGNVGIGTTSPNCNLQVSRNTSTANLFNFLDVVANFGNENPNPGNHYASGIRIYQGNGTMGSGLAALNIGVDTNSAVAESQNTATIETPNGMTQGLRLSTRDSSAPIRFNTDSTERMRITSAGGISFGSSGTAYGATGEVLTSNGNAAPTWQAAGGGSAWPQEKFAEYTIDSTTSNILVATLNSTTWHGNYLAGCLKFTFSTSDYIQVTYLPVSTFLSAGNKLFFKGTEMTTKNNGSNPATITITFAGNNGSYGSTCTVKLNRNQSISTYTKVNVLIQAISNPNMFILN